jgi:CHAT domain-containing protein/tetratricopeptide (TPR) repeat protein
MLAVLLSAASKQAFSQLNLPAATIRFENDTYDLLTRYLKDGDREAAMNLINRDPLTARFAFLRFLHQFGASDLAHRFAEMFLTSSQSEIEAPAMELYEKLPLDDRGPLLNWLELASRAEYITIHGTQERAWTQPTAQAEQNLEQCSQFFKTTVFPTGEAFCLRLRANLNIKFFTISSYERAQKLYEEALSKYATDHNARGEALALAGLSEMQRRMNQRPQMRQYKTQGLEKLKSAGDKVAELHLAVGFPSIGSLEDKKANWAALERMPGLASLKYSALLDIATSDQSYFDVLEAMLAREPDQITASYFDMISFFNHPDAEKRTQFVNRAIELMQCLPYDLTGESREFALASMLDRRGWAEREDFQYSKAESTFLTALEEVRRSTERSELSTYYRWEAWMPFALASLYELTGDYARAIERAEQALAIADKMDIKQYRVQDMGILARIHAELGDLRLAEEILSKATKIDARIPTEAYTDLAQIHVNLGFYDKALNDLDEFENVVAKQRPGGAALAAFVTQRLRWLALTWIRIGDLAKAMEFARAVEARPEGHEIEEGVVGMVWIEMKQYAEAEKYFFDRLAHPEWGKGAEADSHKNLGRIYRLQNRRTEAIEHLTKAVELYRVMFRRRDELELLIELGQVALRGGKPSDARLHFDQALQILEQSQWPQGIWSVRAALADLAKVEKDTNGAVEQLKIAVNAVETVSARLNSELTRSTFVEDRVGLYDELIRLMGPSSPEESFAYAERRRAQSFLETARRQGVPLTSPSSGDLPKRKADVEARLVGKQKALWAEYSKAPATRNATIIDKLTRELDAVRSEHLEILRRMQEADPVEASRQGVFTPITSAEMQRDVLKPGDALVEYLVTNREVFAFVITSHQSHFVPLPVTRDVAEKRIQQLMAPFAQLKSGQVDLLHMRYDVQLAYQLYKDLITPVEPFIRSARRLIVIPDDVLNYVPFESLARSPAVGQARASLTYAEYQNVDWLVNHYSVVYAISATSLHPRLHQPSPEADSLLAFGNPRLNNAQLKDATAALRGAGLDVYIPVLGTLPQSAREAATVARLLRPKVRTTVLIAEQARKIEFQRQAPRAGYIHFAVHSVPNEQQPYYSALVLSPDATSDGLLQTYEIMQTRLNARLVTLSSCETGLGKLYKGEGLLGLRRAFLVAGAESVVVSFWSIDDSTADFMEIFYGNMSRGQSIANALRNSKLQYLKKTMSAGRQQISLSHPFFWAAFALTSTSIQ